MCTNGRQSDDWHSQVDGVSGSAVRSFDTLEAAQQAYGDAISTGLVYRVEQIGERRVLTEDVQSIPGLQGNHDYISWSCISMNHSTRYQRACTKVVFCVCRHPARLVPRLVSQFWVGLSF
jgi:hypothetical protein